jgi:hypothetical protein
MSHVNCTEGRQALACARHLYPTSRCRASVPAIPPMRTAFPRSGRLRYVLRGVSRPRSAVYPIASVPDTGFSCSLLLLHTSLPAFAGGWTARVPPLGRGSPLGSGAHRPRRECLKRLCVPAPPW